MQAHHLDLHRLWLTLLMIAMLLSIGWAGWFFADHITLYENSQSVSLRQGSTDDTVLESVDSQGQSEAPYWLDARFPDVAYDRMNEGQDAQVFVRMDAPSKAIPAKITKVYADCAQHNVLVRLRIDRDRNQPDPLGGLPPARVRVAVKNVAPSWRWLLHSTQQTSTLPCQDDERNGHR